MKECIFRLRDGIAHLIKGDSLPTDRVVLRIEDGSTATLLLAGQRTEITDSGLSLEAKRLPSGLHTLLILSDAGRFEGPPIAIYGDTLFFLPPSHERLSHAEEQIDLLKASCAALAGRLSAIERRIQDTTIF